MKNLDLKPCPFCGNEFPTLTDSNTEGWRLRCPGCNTTFTRDFYEHRGELGKQRLIEAWNRRANDIVQEAEPVRPGRWERRLNKYYCTSCGTGYRICNGGPNAFTFKRCPNCGAKMDGGKSDVED